VDDRPHNTDEIMENQTSFDLSQEIQHWRDNLAQSAAIGRDNLDEMESHLRDSTAALQTCGLSAEESFLIATRRIDTDGRLEAEFMKINGRTVWARKAGAFALVAIVFLMAGAVLTGGIVRWGRPHWASSLLSKPTSQRVTTTPGVQAIKQKFLSNRVDGELLVHTSLVVLDPRTGEVLAMIGGDGNDGAFQRLVDPTLRR
jgi:membrane carboxypeptidase/penicillin-binding protein